VSLHRRTDRCRVDAPGAPVAAYSFNEGSGTTTADATVNNHPGTVINGPTWATGHTGSAVNYDGVNYYVSAGNITALNGLTAVTVRAWVKGSVGASSPDGQRNPGRYVHARGAVTDRHPARRTSGVLK
jgi:hypothetical protein